VTPTIERRIDPKINYPANGFSAKKVTGKTEKVQIVMPSAEFGGDFVDHRSRADAADFVGHDAHSDSRSANENSKIGLTATNLRRNRRSNVRIIDRLHIVRRRSEFDDSVTLPSQMIDNLDTHHGSMMIASNSNVKRHKSFLPIKRG
jgi:hypothetical protein